MALDSIFSSFGSSNGSSSSSGSSSAKYECEDCEYYKFGAFSRWNDHGKCELRDIPRKDSDKACARFVHY